MIRHHRPIAAVALIAVLVAAAACARRPVLGELAVPSPIGVGAGLQPPVTPAAPEIAAPPVPPAPPPVPAVSAMPAAPAITAVPAPPGEVAAGVPGRGRDGDVAAAPAGPSERVAPREFVETPDLADVHFDFDRYDIRPDAAKVLRANARWLVSNPRVLVLIEGHCDERGTNEYNLALGERRARATRNFLMAHGVAAGRMTMISYGEERPVCVERDEACWARNRRAHFLTKAR